MPFVLASQRDIPLSSTCAQHTCEPLRSFEDGLCPFTPSYSEIAKDERIAALEDEVAAARLQLDRYALYI
jgi:hypothetical protein